MRGATLREIAKAAGVHVTTVSRALRDHPSIPSATRERIRQLAEQMGHAANPLLNAWMTYVREGEQKEYQGNLAVILPPHAKNVLNPAYRKIFQSAASRAQQHGYKIEALSPEEHGASPDRLNAIIKARGIRGILVAPFFSDEPLSLEWNNLVAIAIGDRGVTPTIHLTRNHHGGTLNQAVTNLQRYGYRRIGLYLEEGTDEAVEHRWSAEWLWHQNMLNRKHRIAICLTKSGDRSKFQDWFSQHSPDAIISNHIVVLEWLAQLKVNVPDDAGFALLDLLPEHGDCAGMDQHIELTTANAVDLVVEQLNRNVTGIPEHAKTVLTDGTWVDGGTVRNFFASAT